MPVPNIYLITIHEKYYNHFIILNYFFFDLEL